MISMIAFALVLLGYDSVEVEPFSQTEAEIKLLENSGSILFVSITAEAGNSSSSQPQRIILDANVTIQAEGISESFSGPFELRSEFSYIALAEVKNSPSTLKMSLSNPSSQNLKITFESLVEIDASKNIDALLFMNEGSDVPVRTGEAPRSLSILSCSASRSFSIKSDFASSQMDNIFVQKTQGNSRLSLPKEAAIKIVSRETSKIRLIASNLSETSLFFSNNGLIISNSNSFAFPEVQADDISNFSFLAAFGEDKNSLKAVLDCNIPNENITIFQVSPSKRIELPSFERPGYLGVSVTGSELGPFTFPLVQTFSILEYDPQVRRSNLVFQVMVVVLGVALLASCFGVGFKISKLRRMRADLFLEREE